MYVSTPNPCILARQRVMCFLVMAIGRGQQLSRANTASLFLLVLTGCGGRSAIKKVCRRHGIIRWPHRKLLGADKALAVLASKVASTNADPVARATWQTEAVNILVAKLRLTLDPKYLSDWVQLDPVVTSQSGGRSQIGGGSSLLMDGHSTSDEDSLEGGGSFSGGGRGSAHGSLRKTSSTPAAAPAHQSPVVFAPQRAAESPLRSAPLIEDQPAQAAHMSGVDGMDGLYNQLQMVPLHAREAVLMKLLEVQRMSSSMAERPGSRDYSGFASASFGGAALPMQNLVHQRPSDMQATIRGLPTSNGGGIYDDGMQWRPEYANGGMGMQGAGLRMQSFRGEHGVDAGDSLVAAARRLPQALGIQQFRAPDFDYSDGLGQAGGAATKLPGMKQGSPLDLSRPMFHGLDPSAVGHNGFDSVGSTLCVCLFLGLCVWLLLSPVDSTFLCCNVLANPPLRGLTSPGPVHPIIP